MELAEVHSKSPIPNLTEPSKVRENVFLVSEAFALGVRTKSCCTQSSATLFEAILVVAKTSPLDERREAVKEPE